MKVVNFLKTHYLLILLTTVYLAFSFLTFKDYGITFDENTEYKWGGELLNHYTQDTKFKNIIAPVYEGEEKHQRHTPLLSQYYRVYPAVLNLLNVRDTYEFFHLLNLLFATSLIFFSYFLMYSKYKSQFLAVLAPVFIFLTPRFIGHIPANPKDMPFAVIFFAGICAIYYFSNLKNEYLKILLLGIVFGFVQSFRLIGITIYFVYVAYIFFIEYNNKLSFKKNIREILTNYFFPTLFIFIIANFLMVITWPYIGLNYFKNFPEIFLAAQDFQFWDKSMLYMGEYVTIDNRPWHYLPVFIAITTPISILGFAIYNIYLFAKDKKDKVNFLIVSTISINLALYLIASPTIYNGLRHYLFLLPLIAFLGADGIAKLIQNKNKYFRYLLPLVVLNFFIVVFGMYKLHPYEYIYFNELVGGTNKAQENFETEYWGASYKESIEWINENLQQKDSLKVYTCANSYAVDYFLGSNATRVYDMKDSDVLICDIDRFTQYKDKSILHVTIRGDVPLNIVARNK